ncbi:hypothetical protein [Phytohalomonas tamaricis]|uniref:hypothetical protein n=1 Tax=Phytohalomonas tamaricis TaxID=2081032 RepID=UPI000D0B13AB|nr:hypothetical protein [Phytohalomonas tamaricis]
MRPIDLFSISIVLCALGIVLLVPELTLRQVTDASRPDAAGTSLQLRYPNNLDESRPVLPAFSTQQDDIVAMLQTRLHDHDKASDQTDDAPALRYNYPISKRIYSF